MGIATFSSLVTDDTFDVTQFFDQFSYGNFDVNWLGYN